MKKLFKSIFEKLIMKIINYIFFRKYWKVMSDENRKAFLGFVELIYSATFKEREGMNNLLDIAERELKEKKNLIDWFKTIIEPMIVFERDYFHENRKYRFICSFDSRKQVSINLRYHEKD